MIIMAKTPTVTNKAHVDTRMEGRMEENGTHRQVRAILEEPAICKGTEVTITTTLAQRTEGTTRTEIGDIGIAQKVLEIDIASRIARSVLTSWTETEARTVVDEEV